MAETSATDNENPVPRLPKRPKRRLFKIATVLLSVVLSLAVLEVAADPIGVVQHHDGPGAWHCAHGGGIDGCGRGAVHGLRRE